MLVLLCNSTYSWTIIEYTFEYVWINFYIFKFLALGFYMKYQLDKMLLFHDVNQENTFFQLNEKLVYLYLMLCHVILCVITFTCHKVSFISIEIDGTFGRRDRQLHKKYVFTPDRYLSHYLSLSALRSKKKCLFFVEQQFFLSIVQVVFQNVFYRQ
jgi:hypothetical protein